MKLFLVKGSKPDLSTLVLFAAKDKKSGKAVSVKLPAELQEVLDTAQADGVFTGDKKETTFFRSCNKGGFKNVLLVGLGEVGSIDSESLRNAAAVTYGALKSLRVPNAGLNGDSLVKFMKDAPQAVQAAAEGFALSAYDFNELRGQDKKSKELKKKKKDKPKLTQLTVMFSAAPTAAMQKALLRGEVLSECQNFARWLGDLPGNIMTPTRLAEEAVKAAKGTGLKVTVWDKARIEKEKFGGLLHVSLGSVQEPRFIILEYKGAPASQKPVCFVGKGLTFDSGGISIKPGQSMEEMKYDMCGGASVIATLLALAKLKAKVNAIGLVPSTENMPGPNAIKPGDIYFARNGKSIEVFNTDAEGRLILADALVYGSEQKPAFMVDAATLTGAILVGLGNVYSGVFTRNKKLMRQIQTAADATGELVWQMPLDDFHVEDIKGTFADFCNITPGRLAGSSTAAAFLEQFVDTEIPWAHFDIAGTAWAVGNRFPYCSKKGASGIIVRTFVELAER